MCQIHREGKRRKKGKKVFLSSQEEKVAELYCTTRTYMVYTAGREIRLMLGILSLSFFATTASMHACMGVRTPTSRTL